MYTPIHHPSIPYLGHPPGALPAAALPQAEAAVRGAGGEEPVVVVAERGGDLFWGLVLDLFGSTAERGGNGARGAHMKMMDPTHSK